MRCQNRGKAVKHVISEGTTCGAKKMKTGQCTRGDSGTALSGRSWGPLQGGGLELSLISRKGADHAQEEPGAWLREQQVQVPIGHGVSSLLSQVSKYKLKTRGQNLDSRLDLRAQI